MKQAPLCLILYITDISPSYENRLHIVDSGKCTETDSPHSLFALALVHEHAVATGSASFCELCRLFGVDLAARGSNISKAVTWSEQSGTHSKSPPSAAS